MDDAWYTTFVPHSAVNEEPPRHKRSGSLLQQPNVSAIARLHKGYVRVLICRVGITQD